MLGSRELTFRLEDGKTSEEKCRKGENDGKKWGRVSFALLSEITKLE